MKSHFILITAILATTGFSVSTNSVASPPDAQANAQLGDHPAVVIARTAKKGIDPNTFIVAHPAGVRQLAASPSDSTVVKTVASTVAP
ncbi:MAG TPA: hypothetical protein VIU34_36635 [Steroidobacter sp.]